MQHLVEPSKRSGGRESTATFTSSHLNFTLSKRIHTKDRWQVHRHITTPRESEWACVWRQSVLKMPQSFLRFQSVSICSLYLLCMVSFTLCERVFFFGCILFTFRVYQRFGRRAIHRTLRHSSQRCDHNPHFSSSTLCDQVYAHFRFTIGRARLTFVLLCLKWHSNTKQRRTLSSLLSINQSDSAGRVHVMSRFVSEADPHDDQPSVTARTGKVRHATAFVTDFRKGSDSSQSGQKERCGSDKRCLAFA